MNRNILRLRGAAVAAIDPDQPVHSIGTLRARTERRVAPLNIIGSMAGVFAIAARHGLEHLFLLSEPRLARHLNKIGITNTQIGQPTEHRGFRVPAVMDVNQVIGNLEPLLKSVFTHVNAQLDAYQRDAQARVTDRRKPVGWIFCPMVFPLPQLPTVT